MYFYIFNLSLIFSNLIIKPTISMQPKLYLPNLYERNTILTFETGFGPNYISIDFSIDFHISTKNDKAMIYKNYKVEETEVFLEKFYKKEIKENLNNNKKPEIIELPKKEKHLNKFELFIGSILIEETYLDLKQGTQYFSFHSKSSIKKEKNLKKYILNLKKLINFKKDLNIKFAFRFIIKPKILNPYFNDNNIFTKMFEFHFNENNSFFSLNYVNEEDYYLN